MWRIDQHTADVRLRVSAPSLQALFADAMHALVEVMHPLEVTTENVSADIDLAASDSTALLVDFLNDVLTRAHIERAAFRHIRFAALAETSLRATVAGARCGRFEEDVKSVTYHEAQVVRDGANWTVTLVLDI
jgi:SHS2 domain-containing protein